MTTTETVADVMADLKILADSDALERVYARLESALASAEPVAWYTEDHLTDKSATTWDKETAKRWTAKGWPVWSLCTHAQPAAKGESLGDGLRDYPYLIGLAKVLRMRGDPENANALDSVAERIRRTAPTPASVPDGWAMVPRVATSAMISSGWESGKRVGDTRIIISVSGVWDAMISTAAAHNTPASDYALCCDTPAYCSSVRRCTATDAVSEGWGRIPQSITEADAPPHYIPSEKRAYAAGFNWCVAAAQTTMTANPPANQEGTTHDHR